ncbi:hypothetical protein I5Q34_12755 [Streptomyces sp. AV19]|uniref:hypothetical protein n=1 Tax=Streptomyces sp. AV19 TaxID=2793068 RepID=UPI0018FEE094|nr:hypothetical protein [Streptomyces sp. AV19]MBH1935132.1 hypothetical protein [Streptomyces sp. AV19]MDG4531065.1 hypothetical protein [Streptomyces sp. AV19]
MRTAEDAIEPLDRACGRLEELHREIRSFLGHGDGMPFFTGQTVLAQLWDALESSRRTLGIYARQRADIQHDLAHGIDFDGTARALELLAHWAEQAEHLTELADEPISAFTEVRNHLWELRFSLPPVRQRTYAALTEARNDLIAAGPAHPGRFALEAQLNALGDRLRDLDAGRVELVNDDDDVTRWYQEVEGQIAKVRDAMPRPSF